jgi:RNA recognition motif-containing protein
MSTNIYVGNLPFSTTAEAVQELFGAYGTVEAVNLITDRETGRLRGFGFVEMEHGASEAIDALNQTDFGGRTLTVNLAKPRQQRPAPSGRW